MNLKQSSLLIKLSLLFEETDCAKVSWGSGRAWLELGVPMLRRLCRGQSGRPGQEIKKIWNPWLNQGGSDS